jgi:MoxR-like ATPase
LSREDRPSPTDSATAYLVGSTKIGGDGNRWIIKEYEYKSGVKKQRWVRYYPYMSDELRGITHDGEGLYDDGYGGVVEHLRKRADPDFDTEKDVSVEDTDTLIKDVIDGDTMTTTDVEEEGLGALFGDAESPEPVEETAPDEEVEIEKESVMSKLRGSVNIPEEFKFADQITFYTMLRNIFRGKNILVTGPSGCGKSSLGKILADITGKGYYSFNFGDTMNPSAKLLGDTKYNKEDGTWFKPSRFVKAIQDDSFIMLDEVTRDRTGDLANILMPVLDGQKYLALDESEDSDTVEVSPQAFFYATANIGREYLGASHDLDRAWKDRFTGGIYELDYLPPDKEKELVMIRNPQLDDDIAEKIVDFAKRVRDLYKSDELTTAVSTRMCLAVAELSVDGMSLIDALKHTCLPFYPVQGGDDTERVRVIQVIQSMGD